MIFWGKHRIEIIDGDIKKREAIIKPLYSCRGEEPFLVGWDNIQADEGIYEIYHIIKEIKRRKRDKRQGEQANNKRTTRVHKKIS